MNITTNSDYAYEIEELNSDRVYHRTNNTDNKTVYDRDGNICNYGDILYDKNGYKYRFNRIKYIRPHGLFQRFVSVGKAGYKAVLSLLPSDKLYYADTIYIELEWISKWYSHQKFGKGLKT